MHKLEHVVPPNEHHVRRIRDAERRTVGRRERRTWHLRLIRLTLYLLLPLALGLGGLRLWSLRLVADGLVRANVVTELAPARVRVAEVLVEAGQTVQRGDPLARLEGLDRERGLRKRELVLEEALLRLAVVEAGGDLGATDLARRAERLADAVRRVQLAGAAGSVAESELAVLRAQREELARATDQERHGRTRDVARIEAALAASRGELEAATARQELLDFDARQSTELAADGVSSERLRVSAHSELAASRAEIGGISEVSARLEQELDAARQALSLERARGEAALRSMDARVERARHAREALALEERLWEELLVSRRQLGPADSASGAALRELELELARTSVRRAEAELAGYDLELGHGLLRAEKGGRIDRVFVQPGAVVEAGAPIVRTFEPTEVHVFAWVDPAHIERLELGGYARVIPSSRTEPIDGRIVSIDAVWSLAPDQLPHLRVDSGSFMIPVAIDCSASAGHSLLVPNMRVQVVFRTVAAELRTRAAGLDPR